MTPTDMTKKHIITAYVRPARERGEDTVQVRVGNVLKELGWSNRTPSVFSTLSSKSFQAEAGLELLEKRGGPPSGGPSTTWQFTYRILPERGPHDTKTSKGPSGSRLMALYGLCAETFKALGGGEAFLKRERQWGPDAWERYEAELAREKAVGNVR
jgi:hypothetical protein